MELEQVEPGPGEQRLVVRGDVDLDASPRLLQAIRGALRAGASVAVDLQGVRYIDSSGVAVLIQGLKQAGRQGARFVLRNPSARVDSVLELAQLQPLFVIERDGQKR